jgi:hypothetical protein
MTLPVARKQNAPRSRKDAKEAAKDWTDFIVSFVVKTSRIDLLCGPLCVFASSRRIFCLHFSSP